MTEKHYRFFGGLMGSQARWLNAMAAKGYRLIRTEKLLYEWAACTPDAYQYCVEYVGNRRWQEVEEYVRFLKELGYVVFYKNINLNWSVGKVRLDPFAQPGGRLASQRTSLNRELLIVEKANDGKPFRLHTTYEDQLQYLKRLRNPWLSFPLMFLAFWLWQRTAVFAMLAAVFCLPVLLFQRDILRLKREAGTTEC